MRGEVSIKITSDDELFSFINDSFASSGASDWSCVIGSLNEKDCVFAKTTSDREDKLFSLHCESVANGSLHLVWIPFDEEYLKLLSGWGAEVLSSFSYGGDFSKQQLGRVVDEDSIKEWIQSGKTPDHEVANLNLNRCGVLLLSNLARTKYTRVPVFSGVGIASGWFVTKSDEVAYVVKLKQSDHVDVVAMEAKELPLLRSFITDNPYPSVADEPSEPDPHNQLDHLTERINELADMLESQTQTISNLCSITPDLKQINAIICQETERQAISITRQFESLPTSLGIQELKDAVAASIAEASGDIRKQISTTNAALSEIHSYDDGVKNLLLEMNSSLTRTYDDLLQKARDVALKDVSLTGSVATLSEAIDKLGSLRALAEKSDGALDSLVTLLPALTDVQAGILSGAKSLGNSCDLLMKANGKVEECAEQAVAATVAGNNALSAMKQSSLNRDIAMTTMTALTAVASVVSSVASIKKAKGGPRC